MSQGIHLRKYGVQATIDFEVYEIDGVDLRTDWVPAQADCEIMKDGGASTLCDNTATDEGSTYSIVLTATEMQASRLVLKVVDAATKVFLDKVVIIETYGNASAQHAMDFDVATQPVNVTQISGDSAAADNLESMYDGTGYTDNTAPASRSQVDGIGAASGGSLNFANEADNVDSSIKSISFDGVETAGTNASVNSEDATWHQIDDVANNIDIVYQFDVGGGRTAVELTWKGRIVGNNDTMLIKVYNGATWDTVATVSGSSNSAPSSTADNATVTIPLLSTHTGTGSDLGKVFVRLECVAQTNPTIYTDQLLVAAVNIGQSVGYANGQIWINTGGANTNTEAFVDGTADKPVSEIAAAKTLSTAVGLNDFHIINGSSITLAESTANESYFGDNWTLALGGQTATGAHFSGADVSGTHVGAVDFDRCHVGAVTTVAGSHFTFCSLEGTITLPTGDVFFDACHHGGTPVLDFGAAVGSTTVHMHKYAGGIELQNFGGSGTDVLHLDGHGKLTLNTNCSGGTINLRGHWQIVAAGTTSVDVTINYDDQSQGYETGAIWIDTVNGVAGTNDHINGTADNPVKTIADAVTLKSSTGIPDFHLFNGSSITLAASAANNSFFGDHWTLALGGQACGGIYVQGATVSGVGTSAGEEMHFEGCDIGTASVQQGHFDKCGFNGTLTMTTADDYDFHNCYSKGDTAPVFTKTAGQAIVAEFQNYAGDITINGLQAGDTVELGGFFRTITLAGTGGTVHVHGHYETISSGSFSGTLSIAGAIKTDDVAAILADTVEMTGSLAEPSQGKPPVNATFLQMQQWFWAAFTKDGIATATQRSIKNDAGTILAKGTMADDGTTFNQGKLETGP